MALFFNIEKLEQLAGADDTKFMALLYYNYRGELYKPGFKKLPGHSFLLDPDPIFRIKDVDIALKVQYVKLAGRRDYTLYKLHNYTSLDLTYFPDVLLENIKFNPLLKITNDKQLRFKYEELYLRKK